MSSEILTVSALTAQIKFVMQGHADFQDVTVQGEISNYSQPASGHVYFTLKDDKARLRVVMFAGKSRFLRFQIKDGMKVIVQGSLDVFERAGDYQLYAETVQPDGIGALYLAFEQLKVKLEQEGLFRVERKRPLPVFPQRIALVTSATGAAVRDMITTLRRRYPIGHLLIIPVAVQGEEAPRQIAAGIALVGQKDLADVLIVGRGGGSYEELFAFNTEIVARAIVASTVPVVSAVGHETDTSIADFVADVRAATPTAAAELVAPNLKEVASHLGHLNKRMQVALQTQLQTRGERLRRVLDHRYFKDPLYRIAHFVEQVDVLEKQLKDLLLKMVQNDLRKLHQFELRLAHIPIDKRVTLEAAKVSAYQLQLEKSIGNLIATRDQKLDRIVDKLTLLNPLAVMKRGYAVVFQADKRSVITTIDQVQPGDPLHVEVSGGWLDCQVWGVHDNNERE